LDNTLSSEFTLNTSDTTETVLPGTILLRKYFHGGMEEILGGHGDNDQPS
jgi:hypothetical protein